MIYLAVVQLITSRHFILFIPVSFYCRQFCHPACSKGTSRHSSPSSVDADHNPFSPNTHSFSPRKIRIACFKFTSPQSDFPHSMQGVLYSVFSCRIIINIRAAAKWDSCRLGTLHLHTTEEDQTGSRIEFRSIQLSDICE